MNYSCTRQSKTKKVNKKSQSKNPFTNVSKNVIKMCHKCSLGRMTFNGILLAAGKSTNDENPTSMVDACEAELQLAI